MSEVTSGAMVSTIPLIRDATYSEIRDGIGHWVPTPGKVREILLTQGLRGMMPDQVREEYQRFIPDVETIKMASVVACNAVRDGRLIDFGEWTNEAIINGSSRGGPMWSAGGLPSPFNNSFIFMHTWHNVLDGVRYQAAGVYLAVPLDDNTPCEFDLTELQPVVLEGERRLCYGDRARMIPSAVDKNGYGALVSPNIWRFADGFGHMNVCENGGTNPNLVQAACAAAASNVIDPMILALLILNTRNIPRETVRPSEKLLRARMKSGKAPIPPYDVINSQLYVTALSRVKRAGGGEDGGGTHRSPIPHIRLGHLREYPSGKATAIPSTLVNVPPEARATFRSSRSHYVVKK